MSREEHCSPGMKWRDQRDEQCNPTPREHCDLPFTNSMIRARFTPEMSQTHDEKECSDDERDHYKRFKCPASPEVVPIVRLAGMSERCGCTEEKRSGRGERANF